MKMIKLLWLSGITCNANTHSFLNYPFIEQFLNDFEFIYHPVLDSSYTLQEIVSNEIECDVLLIEGSISPEFQRADVSIEDIIRKYAPKVQKIVTVGTCATFGGIFSQSDYKDVTGLHFDKEQKNQKFENLFDKTISISGCPIHPEILVNTLYAIKGDIALRLDNFLRPKEFYAYTVHNGCVRNEYFEYKVDAHQFGELEGCMFYDHGCQAPFTHASCNKILWNEVNSKTRVGLPCFGCTEPTFPKANLFTTKKNMGVPENLPLGVGKRVYLTLAGITKAFKIPRLEKKLLDD
ncbi:MAG: hydrogenase [Epsilonproteobacteria bacterium]|nr:hydrogenase [Campylobacterota bacterium]OIO18138.1 MAG: hydrogenase [Helicobacteraceae bacterium CG1_02_36_14]PIP11157.1 MAG: hydrogenase [Sulfurimonas sp. CG23_combo_of_CG06-09_8_20_14_all_36_33]PIS23694.1 MAG: hydrogenase [Sulfurimonas sp. CG08_land_8_20_14_0_20_36_33]PIU35420.1 MAG: hydrogenase [Sulfurimonas sp. CG07_land_8_20_14_0_80_36_56]PIV05593.1 MAG: hydrogenase [Sulfurimonas sp. CG03_land_8_20_14_0_80_36_25]PIV36651.1 MAG: hydrogenase [Sulfurimonas sp. CG02_land_8_20_14_3_00_36_6